MKKVVFLFLAFLTCVSSFGQILQYKDMEVTLNQRDTTLFTRGIFRSGNPVSFMVDFTNLQNNTTKITAYYYNEVDGEKHYHIAATVGDFPITLKKDSVAFFNPIDSTSTFCIEGNNYKYDGMAFFIDSDTTTGSILFMTRK